MKIPTILVSLTAMLCLLGCSKEGGASGKSKRLIPATAAEIAASTDYKLDHTTKSGIKCYVREISPEVARSITEDSPDHPFLADGEKPYLLVVVFNVKICDLTAEK